MANHLPCGIELPQVFFDGPIDMGHVRNFALRAEHLGYDSLWLQERIIGDVNMLEPVTLLSYVAAITSRLKLGTSVILLPLRNPIQLAKAYATLDVMSECRAVMGVGLGGGHLGSHENVFGYTREGRVTRFTEAVEIMKRLWTEPKASFHGRFWNLDNVAMEPKPIQKPGPPLLVGGAFPYGARRAIAYGDGWVPHARRPAYGDVLGKLPEFAALARAAGRDPAALPITVFGVAEDGDLIKRYRDAGVARLLFNLPPAKADEVLPVLDRCATLMRQAR